MKNIVWRLGVAAMLLAVGACPARARLGETAGDLQKRFGPPLKQLKQPGATDLVQNQYLNHDLLIYVTLYRDTSVVEHYLKLTAAPVNGAPLVVAPLPRELATAILQAAAAGAQWRQMSETDVDMKFARDDQKALAVILKRDRIPVELRICDINFIKALAEPRKN
ncbi:MAG: hypothetical protein LBK76_10920 [Verrucomicrobiales bacterium]|jgi:hypothetical protein|nr:hypothetical protein [Verrucomicrobiales bacterium]